MPALVPPTVCLWDFDSVRADNYQLQPLVRRIRDAVALEVGRNAEKAFLVCCDVRRLSAATTKALNRIRVSTTCLYSSCRFCLFWKKEKRLVRTRNRTPTVGFPGHNSTTELPRHKHLLSKPHYHSHQPAFLVWSGSTCSFDQKYIFFVEHDTKSVSI